MRQSRVDVLDTSRPFGRAWRDEWMLDPAITYLNHGTVGATPRRVIAAQRQIQDEIERQPAQFLLRELSAIRVGAPSARVSRLREAADAVGAFVGARGDDVAFVDNATAGANAVARSLDLHPGDEVIVTTLGYGGVSNGVAAAVRAKHASLVRVDLPFPVEGAETLAYTIERACTPRTRLIVIDHISSEAAIILPVADIARRAHARGVLVLVDGAHVPGNISLDIEALDVDFYTGNLHKWAWAPRSTALLWVRPALQATVHAPVASWGLDQGFTTEFDWVGTRDPSAWLAAPAAIEMMSAIDAGRVLTANHALAWRAGQELCRHWRTVVDTPESMIGAMMTVPVPASLGSTPDDAAQLRDALLFEDHIEVQIHAWQDRLWARVSAQIYNDLADIEHLADAVVRRAR
jgi:isopenicillin-N epimerase